MLPNDFCERMEKMLGDEYPAFLRTYDNDKSKALRLNPLKKRDAGKAVCSEFTLKNVPWEKNGFYYTNEDTPGKHPFHEAGVYYIQEPSAMAPVPFLNVKPGDKVLDLCAAPGGKSTQIASYLKGEGILVSNEVNPQRAKILSENIERMGVTNAIVTNEMPDRLSVFFPMYFDKILVDAPCSGEGMFRKNEEALNEWSLLNVRMCGERQDEILDEAAKMLKPGGRLVYSTCTFAPDENEGSITRFLKRHEEFALADIDKTIFMAEGKELLLNGNPDFYESAGNEIKKTLRLWPHVIKGEGHFAAVLVKKGEDFSQTPINGYMAGVESKRRKELEDFYAFLKESFKEGEGVLKGKVIELFGDNVYLCPEKMPNVKGIKTLRQGLWMGTLKKQRFEPSHALALAADSGLVLRTCNMKLSDKRVNDFLNGMTFNYEGEKGWYLVCVEGYSLGWGKLANGIMKNHYPKGLRKNLEY